jgi:acetyl/propionyl-CoA carboxylase alpha subunit
MEYRLQIGQRTASVNTHGSGNDPPLRITVDAGTHIVEHTTPRPNHYHLVVDGRSVHAYVARGDHEKHIFIHGRVYRVQDMDQLPAGGRRRKSLHESPSEVTPPMPSVVVRILVAEGDRVQKGQSLMVVSAMKMETTLTAPRDGVVKKINTQIDAKVMPGDILVEIDEEVTGDG